MTDEEAEGRKIANLPCLVQVEADDERHISDLFVILTEMGKVIGKEQLFDESAQEVMKFIDSAKEDKVEEVSLRMNEHLIKNVYMVGYSLTAADPYFFAMLAAHWTTLSDETKETMPNLYRWLNAIQHTVWARVQSLGLVCTHPKHVKKPLTEA